MKRYQRRTKGARHALLTSKSVRRTSTTRTLVDSSNRACNFSADMPSGMDLGSGKALYQETSAGFKSAIDDCYLDYIVCYRK